MIALDIKAARREWSRVVEGPHDFCYAKLQHAPKNSIKYKTGECHGWKSIYTLYLFLQTARKPCFINRYRLYTKSTATEKIG